MYADLVLDYPRYKTTDRVTLCPANNIGVKRLLPRLPRKIKSLSKMNKSK